MSITDELRDYMRDYMRDYLCDDPYLSMSSALKASIYAMKSSIACIADNIDAAHERALAEQHESLTVGMKPMADESMAEHGWVRLPKDADGEVIHIGELVDEMLPFGGYAAPAPVDTMELSRGASGYGWMVKLDAENRSFISPKLLRHHHEPTVEDVLRNVVTLCHNTWKEESPFHFYDVDDVMKSGNIAEYAAKLRLAGDAE